MRAKLYIASYTASIMMLLNVFAKPLHIPEAFRWVLIIGVFIPLGLTFYFIKQQKLEAQVPTASTGVAAPPAIDPKQGARRRLILMMALGSVVGLCSPLWMPLTGTSLGLAGNLVCGVITAAVVCAIFGFRLRKL